MRWQYLFDPLFVIPILSLGSVSLAVIGSSNSGLFLNQLIFFAIGILFFIIFARIDYRIYRHLRGLFYILSALLLLLVLFGPNVRGATRWLDIFGLRIQASEIIKPFFFIFLVDFLNERPPISLKNLLFATVLFLPILFLVFKQPDLGNAVVFLGVFLFLLLAGGIRPLYTVLGIFLFLGLLPFIWFHLLDYQKIRILSFINPYSDPKGAGYNALQAIIAIGGGGLWGLGLGRGTQSHLLFLPEFHTDFAFAALVEEFGFLGGIVVLLFYAVLLARIIQIILKTSDPFGRLIGVAIFAQILLQVFINIGMNLGILPITGITLPLLSYGGSSIVSLFISLGILMSVRNRET